MRADVRVEFLPEPQGALNISRQIKQSGKAYPLFGTGRLFLERPERHRVRITSLDSNVPLYQVGDGPVSFDRSAIDRNSFRDLRDQYYKEEVTQGEPIKGNFTNVARTRSGALIGPTNHHSYQPTLRRIYEERYSRRMSFQEFTQTEVEVVSDEQTVNDWKEQARSSTTYTTTQEAEPLTFKSAFEAEQHFRKTYLPALVKSGLTLECTGQASRALPDRNVSNAVREAWEKERAFPAGLVNYLRPYLLEAGLHFFKHRKRILYISAVKPVRQNAGQAMSPGVSAILSAIEASPKCTRRTLATKILGEQHEAPEMVEQKAALARDLHYLAHTGSVIEFHDGTLDLPLIPGGNQQQQGAKGQAAAGKSTGSASAVAAEEAAEEAESASEGLSTPASGDFHVQHDTAAQLPPEGTLQAGTELALETAPLESSSITAEAVAPETLAEFAEPQLQSESANLGTAVAELLGTEPQELPTSQSLVDEAAGAEEIQDPLPVLTESAIEIEVTEGALSVVSSTVAVSEEPAPAS